MVLMFGRDYRVTFSGVLSVFNPKGVTELISLQKCHCPYSEVASALAWAMDCFPAVRTGSEFVMKLSGEWDREGSRRMPCCLEEAPVEVAVGILFFQ